MAILDQSYQPWSGDLQPRWRRVGALVRVGIRQAYAGWMTKLVLIGTYGVMFSWVGLLFLFANFRMPPAFAQGNTMFRLYLGDMLPMGLLVMTLAAIVGGKAIAVDLRSNAVSMLLSKAITRSDYILGKAAIVGLFLLSATLAPGLLLWFGHWSLVPDSLTVAQRLSDLLGILIQSLAFVVPATLYVLMLSSLTRNAYVPGILWAATYLGSAAAASLVGLAVDAEWCKLLSWPALLSRIGELAYVTREAKATPLGINLSTGVAVMPYGWGPPLAILGSLTVLSFVVLLRRLRKFEGDE